MIKKVGICVELITNGVTRPTKIKDKSGDFYVMKCLHESCSSKILFNELVSYRLGKLLDIPMPVCELGDLDEETINSSEILTNLNAQPCTCFLSSYVSGTPHLSPIIANKAVNAKEISSIIIFDQIIMNNDRARNPGNLFYDKSSKCIIAIDHSHIFLKGELWNTYELGNLKKDSPIIVPNILGLNYKIFAKHLVGHSPFNQIEAKIKTINVDQINQIFEGIPLDWNISNEEIVACKDFIITQLNEVDGIISQVQNIYSIKKGAS